MENKSSINIEVKLGVSIETAISCATVLDLWLREDSGRDIRINEVITDDGLCRKIVLVDPEEKKK